MSERIGITVILVLLKVCWASALSFGGHGWGSDKISLGEISLGDHGHHLPAITLEYKGDDGSYEGWPKSSWHSWGGHSSSLLDYTIDIPKEYHDKVIPIVKEVGVPVLKEIPIKIPHIVPESVPQPYPVLVPVAKPVPYEVVKHVIKYVEKKVPTPVEKIIPVPVEKHVPFEVHKSIPEVVIKKVPFKVPVYKTIVHKH